MLAPIAAALLFAGSANLASNDFPEPPADAQMGDGLRLTEPSTRSFAGMLKACGLEGRKVLFVTAENAPVLVLSGRNIPGVQIRTAETVGTYDIVAADVLLLERAAVDALNTRSFEHKIAAVTKLAAFAHPRAITVLTALLKGSLYVTKKTKQVVIVAALELSTMTAEGNLSLKVTVTDTLSPAFKKLF